MFARKPGSFFFNQSEMRKHLFKCFLRREMTQFPVKRVRHSKQSVKRTEEVQVYCKCRMPELPGSRWIECSKCGGWYHLDTCVHVANNTVKLTAPGFVINAHKVCTFIIIIIIKIVSVYPTSFHHYSSRPCMLLLKTLEPCHYDYRVSVPFKIMFSKLHGLSPLLASQTWTGSRFLSAKTGPRILAG